MRCKWYLWTSLCIFTRNGFQSVDVNILNRWNFREYKRKLKLSRSIHWLNLLLEYILPQYEGSPSLTADKMLIIFIYSCFVEQVEDPAICFSQYGLFWSFGFLHKVDKVSYSSLSRIFIDDMNTLWLDKC